MRSRLGEGIQKVGRVHPRRQEDAGKWARGEAGNDGKEWLRHL